MADFQHEKCELLRLLAIDLEAGTLQRTVPSELLGESSPASTQVPAFKLLSLHLPELKKGEFSLFDRKNNNQRIGEPMKLPLLSDGRASRSTFGQEPQPTDAPGEVRMALKELAKATKCIYEVLKQRLAAVGPGEDMKVKLMSQCFCLRRLALSDATFDMSVAEGALRSLREWFNSRNTGYVDIGAALGGQASGSHSPLPDDLPSDASLVDQFRLLVDRMRTAALHPYYRGRWTNARDVVVAEDVLTRERFFQVMCP
jgi:hypothetical protein